jgi:hypothetical protein
MFGEVFAQRATDVRQALLLTVERGEHGDGEQTPGPTVEPAARPN